MEKIDDDHGQRGDTGEGKKTFSWRLRECQEMMNMPEATTIENSSTMMWKKGKLTRSTRMSIANAVAQRMMVVL
jgi:hypothetical protein